MVAQSRNGFCPLKQEKSLLEGYVAAQVPVGKLEKWVQKEGRNAGSLGSKTQVIMPRDKCWDVATHGPHSCHRVTHATLDSPSRVQDWGSGIRLPRLWSHGSALLSGHGERDVCFIGLLNGRLRSVNSFPLLSQDRSAYSLFRALSELHLSPTLPPTPIHSPAFRGSGADRRPDRSSEEAVIT